MTSAYARVQSVPGRIDLAGLAPLLRCFLRANVASPSIVLVDPTDTTVVSAPGCVIASPSYPAADPQTDQDYVYHWIRDAAIVATELAAGLPAGSGPDRTLGDYVAFSATCRTNAAAAGVSPFRAAFLIDGRPRGWSDQKDGLALQALSFLDAWDFLDDPARATAASLTSGALAAIVAAAGHDDAVRGPWEDLTGESFFALAAQIRFLDRAAERTAGPFATLSPDDAAHAATVATELRTALDAHWDGTRYLSIPGGKPDPGSVLDTSVYDPNADVVMACLYGSVPATEPRLLATAAQLRAHFDVGGPGAYGVNAIDRDRGLGPMIGRYPSDDYDGDIHEPPNEGHPWAICTANLAELYYRVARAARAGDAPPWTDLTRTFYSQVDVGQAAVEDATQAGAVADALVSGADRMLQAIVHHSDHNRLSEQFDRNSGFEKSVQDLSWSYAAVCSALRAREAAR